MYVLQRKTIAPIASWSSGIITWYITQCGNEILVVVAEPEDPDEPAIVLLVVEIPVTDWIEAIIPPIFWEKEYSWTSEDVCYYAQVNW